MFKAPCLYITFFISAAFFSNLVFAQPTWTLEPFGKEKKPAQYEEKILASEKTGEKKLTTFKRIVQNTTTHFNFYFNANNKLNAVIERAKLSQKDDYASLLSFYPYSIENTAAQKTELDSVIYKATAGLLLHDLRSDWVDNMYLLIGKSYYLRNEMDSAALTFQFINYNLFPRKKKEDDNRIVGTNDAPGTGTLSIANKENQNILQKTFSIPPSRNDALIWLARTFTSQEAYGDAAGLINILQFDKNLPARLQNDLQEVTAYWFFAQKNYDSAATHLELALNNADNKQDKSRWEFLLAQLYEMNGQYDKASSYYARASKHTVDIVMDIHAQLNAAKMIRDNADPKQLDNSINNLVKMARKDRFDNYRDIIYFSAAQLALQKKDSINGIVYLTRATTYPGLNKAYKNKSFLQLGDIAYGQGNFKEAHSFYDSLQLSEEDNFDVSMLNALTERRNSLAKIVERIINIEREDSLQRVAIMAPAERDAYVKKLVKKLRKEKGLKEEEPNDGRGAITLNSNKDQNTDLFQTNSKGEWYFYNTSLRSRGLAEFTNKWGKRTNTDNWRRIKAAQPNAPAGFDLSGDPFQVTAKDSAVATTGELNFDALMSNLPLTAEKMDSSNAIVAQNLLELAKLLQYELQEFPAAIKSYEEYLNDFPGHADIAEAYLGLFYCYSKLGDISRANYYKNLLTSKYAGSKSATMVVNPSLLQPNAKNPEVTARYEGIYNLFIEGRFAEALETKKKADSVFGSNYWTPQLLYIEAVHYIKERQDSNAIATLTNLKTLYPQSPLKEKAATLIDVLGRRNEIENYLTNLDVSRKEEEQVVVSEEKAVQKPVVTIVQTVTPKKVEPTIKAVTGRDSSFIVPPVAVNAGFSMQPEQPHLLAMVLNKVDGVYVNEARNAFTRFNKESYLTQNLVIRKDTLDADNVLLLFSNFEDAEAALKYFDKIKKAAPREVSWLQANKYSFLIISEKNLQVLQSNKDLTGYKLLLNNTFGNKF